MRLPACVSKSTTPTNWHGVPRPDHRRASPLPTMPKHLHVFLGAPSPASLQCSEGDFEWETLTTTTPILDASVVEAASRWISRIYKDTNFAEADDEDIEGKSSSNFLDAEHSSKAAETFITSSTTRDRTSVFRFAGFQDGRNTGNVVPRVL